MEDYKEKIYILDDCESTIFALRQWLKESFEVTSFSTPSSFIDAYSSAPPHLCIVDFELNADRNGLDVIKELNHLSVSDGIPFIFISRNSKSYVQSHAYELGVVDFIPKPIDKDLFQMKISNLIKLLNPMEKDESSNLFEVDSNNYTVLIKDQVTGNKLSIKLTPKEFIVFKKLYNNQDSIVSREQILSELETNFNDKFLVDRVVDVHICNIKKKLGPSLKDVLTSVYGVGYRLDSEKKAA